MIHKHVRTGLLFATVGVMAGCGSGRGSFGYDKQFLRQHTDAVVLADESGQKQIIVVPQYQGRVMTSTAQGDQGMSYGWINYDLIASGKTVEKINVFGGEDRLWLAPEGGQYALFFAPGKPFDIANWQTPAVLDTEPFEVIQRDSSALLVRKVTRITNYHGTSFDVRIDRQVRVLNDRQIARVLGIEHGSRLQVVAYESSNTLTNVGQTRWSREKGLLGIWMLGQYNPSDSATTIIPLEAGREVELGPMYEDSYFGKIAPERLTAGERVILFKGDGKSRGKVGVSAKRARDILGSYDPENHILTIVKYSKPQGACAYVKNTWGLQDKPYEGEAVMSYNDGPLGPGLGQLGPFYELETASPAVELEPNQAVTHVQTTCHFQGAHAELNALSMRLLGVSLDKVVAFVAQ